MSKKLKARGRVTRKMTKDGLVERNAATGEDIRVSNREAELDLRGATLERELHGSDTRLSQVGKSPQAPQGRTANRKQVYRHSKSDAAHGTRSDTARTPEQTTSPRPDDTRIEQPEFTDKARADAALSENTPVADIMQPAPSKHNERKSESRLNTESHGRLQFAQEDAAPAPKGKQKQKRPRTDSAEQSFSESEKSGDAAAPDEAKKHTSRESAAETADTPKPNARANQATQPQTAPAALQPDKSGKLQFKPDETMPDSPKITNNRKLGKAQAQAERTAGKLEKARGNLPAKRKLRKVSVMDEKSGTVTQRLRFEKTPISQGEHIKGAKPLRPVKAAGNTLMLNAHRKLYQVEHENVSVKAAHRAEMLVEGGVRAALRFRKTAPYRKVAKLEQAAQKKSIKLTYQRTLAQNPKLKSNVLTRAMQKRRIKKDYAKAAREAQKAAKRAKEAGSATAKIGKALIGIVKRHPVATAVIGLIALLLFMLMSLIGAFGGMGSGGLGGILTSSYLAEDADIDIAEVAYTEWEVDLQLQIANTETDRPGFDEYRYNVGDISHNPYELMAYLTVAYQNFPYSAIAADLRALFDEQYALTFTESTETRYADPDDSDGDGDYEPYEWKILTVTLTARSFTDVAAYRLSGDQFAHYALLLQTKGNRQYVGRPFAFDWLPYVTSYYGYRIHPISGAKDLHRGVDIGIAGGTEIISAQDGTVTFAGWDNGYGNYVVIENEHGLMTKYAHCETLLVSAGQPVFMGDVIATVGSTGTSTGNHLHFEVLKDEQYLNPLYFADTGSFNLMPSYGYAGAPMGDGSYAALIAEAELHLGKPYLWGGFGPNSFDCSGFVSYVLIHSGVKNTGRLGAQGLYNISTPVSPSEARPGDLIFFHSTYSAPLPVTHVGIYVGGSPPMMIHAGNPISYTRIDTTYWQNHFYAFGRIN